MTINKFDIEKFKVAANGKLVIEDIEINDKMGLVYIYFNDNQLKYIRASINYEGRNNCINIYHGESTKNGYWFDGKLDYDSLVNELLPYSQKVQ